MYLKSLQKRFSGSIGNLLGCFVVLLFFLFQKGEVIFAPLLEVSLRETKFYTRGMNKTVSDMMRITVWGLEDVGARRGAEQQWGCS